MHLRHTSDSSAKKRCLCLCDCVHSTKVGSPSLAALFLLKAGYCEDSLKTLYEESVLSVFQAAVERCVFVWLSWTLIFPFSEVVREWSIQQLAPLLVQSRTEAFQITSMSRGLSQMLLNLCVTLDIPL